MRSFCHTLTYFLLRNDSIFYIHAAFYSSGPYSIHELLEDKGVMKWNKLANFGSKKYLMTFPEIIRPMENGEFIFFPRRTRSSDAEDSSFDDLIFYSVEFWEKNQRISRTPMKLPLNLTDDLETLWIFQL